MRSNQSPPSKLSVEEQEDLVGLIEHPGILVLTKFLNSIAEDFEHSVISLDLSNGDEKELVRRKCRAEGARMLLGAFQSRLVTLKAKQKA